MCYIKNTVSYLPVDYDEVDVMTDCLQSKSQSYLNITKFPPEGREADLLDFFTDIKKNLFNGTNKAINIIIDNTGYQLKS